MYHKILIISLSGIGDSLLFSPALKVLHASFPAAEIHVLVMFRGVENYFRRFQEVKTVHSWDFVHHSTWESVRYVWSLRREQYDLVINAYPSNRAEYNVVAKILGKRQAGHRYLHFNFGNLFFLNQVRVKEEMHRHPVEENLNLVRALGATGEPAKRLLFPLSAEEERAAEDWIEQKELRGKTLVGFHAGSSTLKNHIRKRWAGEKFAELGKKLRDRLDVTILVFGGPEEKSLVEDLCRWIRWSVYAVQDTSIGVTAALMKKCRLFVSNDTALMHIAAALQVPCVAVFGPTDVRKGRPYHSSHLISSRHLSCSPCFYYSPIPLHCRWKTFECLRDLTVGEVEECCDELLKAKKSVSKMRVLW